MRVITFIGLWLISQCNFAQSLEQFLSQPIESNIVASDNARKIAWVINEKGVRNIMLKIDDESPKAITNFLKDDGLEIKQLSFSANSTKITFLKGTQIFYKDVSSQFSALKLSEGSEPLFFPDGLKILFLKQGQFFETNLEVSPEVKSVGENPGLNYALKLSPNGNEVLFTSERSDKTITGIYDIASQKVRWISSDNVRDRFPCWSRDGKQIAFFRTTNLNKRSICIADASTFAVKTIWNSSEQEDDTFLKGISKPLYWTSTNRILFYSEQTGWRHIFSMNADGSDLKDLTPGDAEADNFTIDSYAQNIYFSSNRDDAERRHIWKSNLTANNLIQLTNNGIETDPVMIGINLYCFRSTTNSSNLLMRINEIRKTTTPVIPIKPVAVNYFVKPETVAVPTVDGNSIGGQLYIDRLLNGKRIPLVFIHGGPQQQMLSGFHSNEIYSDCYAFNQYLASIGYAVIAINYRGSSGYGRDFRKSDSKKEIQDITAAAKFLQLLPEVEKTKIGVFGLGYGGNLVESLLAGNSELFKAGINIQLNDGSGFGENGLKPAEISKWSSPFFLIGNKEQLQTKSELIGNLKTKNISVDVTTLSGANINSHESRMNLFKSVQDFFDKKLK